LSLCAIAWSGRAGFDAVRFEMAANSRFIEWLYPKAEMIEVASFFARCCAARSTEFAIHRHSINDGSAGSQLNQADLILASLDRTSENSTIEAKHVVDVDNAQHKMVDFTNADHRWWDAGLLNSRLGVTA